MKHTGDYPKKYKDVLLQYHEDSEIRFIVAYYDGEKWYESRTYEHIIFPVAWYDLPTE